MNDEKLGTDISALKKTLSLSSELDATFKDLASKQDMINGALKKSIEAEDRYNALMRQLDKVDATVLELDDRRETLLQKFNKMHHDSAFLTKNNDKLQTFIARYDQIEELFKELSAQSDRAFAMRSSYDKYQKEMEEDIAKAQRAVKALEKVIADAEKIALDAYREDGGAYYEPLPERASGKPRRTVKQTYDDIDADTRKTDGLVIDLYKTGWDIQEIVRVTMRTASEIQSIIDRWKKQG